MRAFFQGFSTRRDRSFYKLVSFLAALIAPAAVSLAILAYFQIVHVHLYYGFAKFGYWIIVFLIPPVVLEMYFTNIFEARIYGYRRFILYGLIGRLLFIYTVFYILIWKTLQVKNTTDVLMPMVDKSPYVFEYFWIANPKIGIVLGLILLIIYLFFTCRLRLFRLTTTVLLPISATFSLFYLFYFPPEIIRDMAKEKRPKFVEKLFPTDEYKINKDILKNIKFPRDIYVKPDDNFVVATFGATYGNDIKNKPNFIWIDLKRKKFWFKRFDTIRRFHTECPQKIYFTPWHGSKFYSFDTASGKFEEFDLPKIVNGHAINEVNFTYYACDTHTVYIPNSVNPVLFVWDAKKNRLKKTIALAGHHGLMFGDTVAMIARNPRYKRLYQIMVGRYQFVEIDEETLIIRRIEKLPTEFFEVYVSPDGKELYLPAAFKQGIWKLDSKTLRVIKKFKSPIHCRKIFLSRNGKYLLAASYVTGDFIVYDSRTGEQLLKVYISPKLEGMYGTDNFVYFLGTEGLFRISFNDILEHLRKEKR